MSDPEERERAVDLYFTTPMTAAQVVGHLDWHDHERIKQSPGWMSPVQYRQSQGTAA